MGVVSKSGCGLWQMCGKEPPPPLPNSRSAPEGHEDSSSSYTTLEGMKFEEKSEWSSKSEYFKRLKIGSKKM